MNKFLLGSCALVLFAESCNIPKINLRSENKNLPNQFSQRQDSTNLANLNWKTYFQDSLLIRLIDTALANNQELNIVLQEIQIGNNEVQARKGEYLPFVNLKAGTGLEKQARYTRNGAVEEQLEIRPGRHFPEPLGDAMVGAYATWEVDVWKKLRNAKKAAVMRYLASIEGKNLLVTNLISEIAEAYYELMALDNLLQIVEQNIEIQRSALNIMQQRKDAAKATQLAVNRFQAQLLNTQNRQYQIRQQITQTENRINLLTGRYPSPILRSSNAFLSISLDDLQVGLPSELLSNRPDIRQAELELAAAKLDVQVARANFYPSFRITAGLGFQAFNPIFLLNPKSILFNLAGDLVAPLVNKNGIKAAYKTANAKQLQAILRYERSILNAYLDVLNQMAKIDNAAKSYQTKAQEVEILNNSIGIANSLFNSGRADYGEVLLVQREALDAKMELIEIKSRQLEAKVNIYRALGGGWK
jgi:NodT family efflux transporter outer membrane factor (OMF) lipoprotein